MIRKAWELWCDECDGNFAASWEGMGSSGHITKASLIAAARKLGWKIGKRHICDACNELEAYKP